MSDPSTEKPIYKRWYFWVGLLVFVSVCSNLTSSDGDTSQPSSSEGEQQPVTSQQAIETAFEYEVLKPKDSMGRPTGWTTYLFNGDRRPGVEWNRDAEGWISDPRVASVNVALETVDLPTVTARGRDVEGVNSSVYEWPDYPEGRLWVTTSGCPGEVEGDCVWKLSVEDD